MTLTEFLLQRLAEDEAVAKAADGSHWTAEGVRRERNVMMEHETFWEVDGPNGGWIAQVGDLNDGEHIARHDPARVLADVEAKRAIIALHTADHECAATGDGYAGVFAADGSMPTICETALALAQPYRDHPDYREEWRP